MITSLGRPRAGAGDPADVGALGRAHGDRAGIGDDQRRAGRDAADRERRDEGRDLELDVGKAAERAGERAGERRQHEPDVTEARQGERHDHARERSDRLDREVDPAQHDDESDADRHHEQGGSVRGQDQERLNGQELGRDQADQDHQREQRQERHRLPQMRAPRSDRARSHQGYTMCSISSTCSGLLPAAASKRLVITPSRMTRMVWLRPIVSSSVSAVRMIPMPSSESARISS